MQDCLEVSLVEDKHPTRPADGIPALIRTDRMVVAATLMHRGRVAHLRGDRMVLAALWEGRPSCPTLPVGRS